VRSSPPGPGKSKSIKLLPGQGGKELVLGGSMKEPREKREKGKVVAVFEWERALEKIKGLVPQKSTVKHKQRRLKEKKVGPEKKGSDRRSQAEGAASGAVNYKLGNMVTLADRRKSNESGWSKASVYKR